MAFDGPRARQISRGADGKGARQFGDAAVESGQLQVELARGQGKYGRRKDRGRGFRRVVQKAEGLVVEARRSGEAEAKTGSLVAVQGARPQVQGFRRAGEEQGVVLQRFQIDSVIDAPPWRTQTYRRQH